MESTSISFVSSRNRGMTPDLELVKSYLMKTGHDYSFRFFTKSELSANPMSKKGVRQLKKEFCKNLGHTFFIDSSVPSKLAETALEGNKILLAAPYDYQFTGKELEDGKRKETFDVCTHVFTFSPFSRRVMEERYQMKNAEIVDGFCSPLAWDINQPIRQEVMEQKVASYFPAVKDKKIVSLITNGKVDADNQPFGEEFDLKRFMDYMGEDWFLLTNCSSLVQCAVSLGIEYIESFGYINNILSNHDMLYVSDMLITNNSMLASAYASCQKPLYFMKYGDSEFDRYMSKRCPEIYLENSQRLYDISFQSDELYTQKHDEICRELSYLPIRNPFEKICELVYENKR